MSEKKNYVVELDLGITVLVENARDEVEAYEMAEDQLPISFGQYIHDIRAQEVSTDLDTARRHADFKVDVDE